MANVLASLSSGLEELEDQEQGCLDKRYLDVFVSQLNATKKQVLLNRNDQGDD